MGDCRYPMKGNEWQNICSRLDLLLDWALAGKFQALYMDIQGLLDTPEQFIHLVQYLHLTWPTEFSETKPTRQFQLQSYTKFACLLAWNCSPFSLSPQVRSVNHLLDL